MKKTRKQNGKGIKIVNNTPLMVYYIGGTIIAIAVIIITVAIYFRKPHKPSPIIEYLKGKLSLVDRDFLTYDIRESDESFTENKTTIYICTKDPNTNKYYSENTLVYVALHECAHYKMEDYDENHSKKFIKVFNDLLKKAIKVGIYDPNIPVPKTYCKVRGREEIVGNN